MNHIYFAGYDAQHPDDFIFDIPEGYDCYLLLITTTPARFWVDGRMEEYPPHCAILYPPRHKIWYGATTGYVSDPTSPSSAAFLNRPGPFSYRIRPIATASSSC